MEYMLDILFKDRKYIMDATGIDIAQYANTYGSLTLSADETDGLLDALITVDLDHEMYLMDLSEETGKTYKASRAFEIADYIRKQCDEQDKSNEAAIT